MDQSIRAIHEKVKQASVSYFNKLHDLETTCTKMIIS